MRQGETPPSRTTSLASDVSLVARPKLMHAQPMQDDPDGLAATVGAPSPPTVARSNAAPRRAPLQESPASLPAPAGTLRPPPQRTPGLLQASPALPEPSAAAAAADGLAERLVACELERDALLLQAEQRSAADLEERPVARALPAAPVRLSGGGLVGVRHVAAAFAECGGKASGTGAA